ncbi:hypothetical protein DICPUDRAFT_147256 [Dictyostelium purpureum]|uniref:DNL-type domain-containing protein n=1 Tax=Dictyostelium purpureum TaxID=5786 RepID=F0Z819_DICPU|nr:uncharacterized protein DICPUDRAFT_147256 [Dictyostelium purpureum]EGC39943.1 hypothetical protein DICPUDRAFT_147256 [Dictyostelium purpureum]|eukprot:XP_003283572.1 hypothetical protein DICPUDRAFT_147256 [Dictyostelium purpureum]
MKRFITNISKYNLLNNSNKLLNLNRNYSIISKPATTAPQQYKSLNQIFNINSYNNNEILKSHNRFYCKAPSNKSEEITDAEIDIHKEDDDPNGQFKPSEVNGIKIEPKYYIEFTCTYVNPSGDGSECGFVSRKTFSKHSYHKGVVLIRCDGCKKIHTIADNLGWTGYENAKNIEEIMKEKGEEVRKYLLKGEKIFPHDSEQNVDTASSSDGPILIGGTSATTTSDKK